MAIRNEVRIRPRGFRLLLATALLAFVVRNAAAQDRTIISLPTDPSIAVITLDWSGGDILGLRKNMNPALTIRANGAMTVTDPKGNVADIESTLSAAQVQDLLRFIITDQDFFSINVNDIQNAIAADQRRTGIGYGVADASDTVVHIQTADREQELRFYALGIFANRYPSMKALGQFNTVETKLRRLIEESRAGGKQGIAIALEQANVFLKQQDPLVIPLIAEDYSRTLQFANGRKLMQFQRNAAAGWKLLVTVEYVPGEEPKVTAKLN